MVFSDGGGREGQR
uniref:Uncharacterized protein n=1 Tax=Arundo donax TaxID=35708 RepID=A0A0A9D5N5_ARUDO